MSTFLSDAREKLRGALADLDGRLAELQAFKAEEAQLQEHRAALVVLLGEDIGRPPSEVSHASVTPTPAAAAPPPPPAPPSSAFHPDATAQRILAIVAKRGLATSSEVHTAARAYPMKVKRLLNALIDAGQLVRTGQTQSTRYSLPTSGRAQPAAAPADSEGDRGRRRAARR